MPPESDRVCNAGDNRKGNRDTACFSIMDFEWSRLQQAFDAGLKEHNFDQAGQQLRSLGDVRTPLIEE